MNTTPPPGPSSRPAEGPIERAWVGISGNIGWLTRPILPGFELISQ
jgi:hypothetical protein